MNPRNKLTIKIMSKNAIPQGGGFLDGLRFLRNKESIANGYREARKEMEEYLSVLRESLRKERPDKSYTDDELAEMILEKCHLNKTAHLRG